MRTVTKTFNVYKYSELSPEAKEEANRWYLDDPIRPQLFQETVEEELKDMFDRDDLAIQFSIGAHQGSGLNIYGRVSADSIIALLDKENLREPLENLKGLLTDKEKKTILSYGAECSDIGLRYNSRYCYSLAQYIDFSNDWEAELYDAEFETVDMTLVEKFERFVRMLFEKLNSHYEELGYKYFYEPDEEEIEDSCEDNNWEFLEDGRFYID